MEITWNTEKGHLIINFTYPCVKDKCIDEVNNTWKSSRTIIQDAIDVNLKGTNIMWSNAGSTDGLMSSVLTLDIRFNDTNKNISLRKLNDLLYKIDKEISIEIYNLINDQH